MPTKATFSSHVIRPDGLHIISVTDEGVKIDTLIPREDAEALGFIDSDDGIMIPEQFLYSDEGHFRKQQKELAKLAEWNMMTRGA